MSEAAGLVFSESMAGPFALGASDPSSGAADGRATKSVLTMRVTITIADIAAFVRDASHVGRLDGTVSFAPLGSSLRAEDGVVRLFAPADGGSRKVMYYGLRLVDGERHRYLAGVKHVDGHSVFALWNETTTLYTRLHDGPDETAPVIGAGILRLRPVDLLRTLPTMQPTPAAGFVRGTATLARFGEFFVGQLWSSYVTRRPMGATSGEDARRV
jgi:hypothetical protein